VPYKAGFKWYVIDVVAKHATNCDTIAVECGDCKKDKIEALKP
jgi:hypothetical protein